METAREWVDRMKRMATDLHARGDHEKGDELWEQAKVEERKLRESGEWYT